MNSNSEPWVSAPNRSVPSSVSRKVSVCELGPYASTLILERSDERNCEISSNLLLC